DAEVQLAADLRVERDGRAVVGRRARSRTVSQEHEIVLVVGVVQAPAVSGGVHGYRVHGEPAGLAYGPVDVAVVGVDGRGHRRRLGRGGVDRKGSSMN